jgi:rubrerythrin
METKFNVFEILEIAERVEQRGASFYAKTAELFEKVELQRLYYQLAEGKAKQQKTWIKMRKEFSEKTGEFGTIDPDNYVLSHPEVMAGLTWLGTGNGIRKKIRGTESKEEILKDAINRENAVITFFQGLKDFARDPASKDAVNNIVAQENRHVLNLINQINQISD